MLFPEPKLLLYDIFGVSRKSINLEYMAFSKLFDKILSKENGQ